MIEPSWAFQKAGPRLYWAAGFCTAGPNLGPGSRAQAEARSSSTKSFESVPLLFSDFQFEILDRGRNSKPVVKFRKKSFNCAQSNFF